MPSVTYPAAQPVPHIPCLTSPGVPPAAAPPSLAPAAYRHPSSEDRCLTPLTLTSAASCLARGSGRRRLRRQACAVAISSRSRRSCPSPTRPLRNPRGECAVPIRSRGDAVLPLSKGRGRRRRTRRQSVRGLPRNQARKALSYGRGGFWRSRQNEGEGSSAHPPPGYAKVS